MPLQTRRSPLWPDRRVGPRDTLWIQANRSHPLCPTRAWLPRVDGPSVITPVTPPILELVRGYAPASMGGSNTHLAGISPKFGRGVEFVASGDGVQGIDCGLDTDLLPTTPNVTIIVTKRFTGTPSSNKGGTFGVHDQASGVNRCGFTCPFTDNIVYWDFGGFVAGTSRLSVSGLTFGDDIWALTVGSRGMEIWQNSIKVGSNAAAATRTSIVGDFYIGSGNDQAAFVRTDNCVITLLYIYHRQLSESDIVSICNDPHQWLDPVMIRRPIRRVPSARTSSVLLEGAYLADTSAASLLLLEEE